MNNKSMNRIVYLIDDERYVDGNIVLKFRGHITQIYHGDCNDFKSKYGSVFEYIEIVDTLDKIIVKDKSLTENLPPFKVSKYFDKYEGFLTIPPIGTIRRSKFFNEVMDAKKFFVSLVSKRIKEICNLDTTFTIGIAVIDLCSNDIVGDLYI